MATDPPPDCPLAAAYKVRVPLRLPLPLVQFLDQQAQQRFTTRNEIIQSLVVEAYQAAHPTENPSDV